MGEGVVTKSIRMLLFLEIPDSLIPIPYAFFRVVIFQKNFLKCRLASKPPKNNIDVVPFAN